MQLPLRRACSSKANNKLQLLISGGNQVTSGQTSERPWQKKTSWLLPFGDSNTKRRSELWMWTHGIVHRPKRMVFNFHIWSSEGIQKWHAILRYSARRAPASPCEASCCNLQVIRWGSEQWPEGNQKYKGTYRNGVVKTRRHFVVVVVVFLSIGLKIWRPRPID